MVKKYTGAILWSGLVIILSLLPSSSIQESKMDFFPHFDKVVHFIMYAVLTFLILRKNNLGKGNLAGIKRLIFTGFYPFSLGFFLEILQNSFLIGRNFDIFDVLANTSGIFAAMVVFKMFHH